MDIEHIKALIQAAHGAGLSELTVRQDGGTIRIQRGTPTTTMQASEPVAAAISPEPTPSAGLIVESPMPGAFFRAQNPDAAPFVEPGSTVEPGQTLALIEAMKMLTPVKAPVRGIIRQIHAENGSMVQIGQPLFTLEETA